MGLLKNHRNLRTSSIVAYHRFLLNFRCQEKAIHAFFEGQEDQSYYINHLQSKVPNDWTVYTYYCGNKDGVYNIFEKIDWETHPKEKILFFVDKDLSDIIGEQYPIEQNIYVTGFYSTENYLVNSMMLERVLREIYHLKEEKVIESIIRRFEINLERFYKHIRRNMAWIICCRRNSIRPQLQNIKIKKIFAFNQEGILKRDTPRGYNNILEYCEHVCSTSKIDNLRFQIKETLHQLRGIKNPKDYVRGKFELEFFVLFMNYIWENLTKMGIGISRKPKIHTNIGLSNAMEILGPRSMLCESLETFLLNNISKTSATDI